MTDSWNRARGEWTTKLELLDILLKQLRSAGRQNREIDAELRNQNISVVERDLAKQLKKLQDNEFHIAVVGLEKSGKSTFLNAWLKSDLLPNADLRCTYTTTELRSVSSLEEQRVVIEFLSEEDFAVTISQYEELARGKGTDAENAKKDLEEIKQLRGAIDKNLGQPSRTIHYQSLDEIREDLRYYIADPGAARSVRTVKLYSRSLLNQGGLVFHDVPGFDSPTQFHKELAKQELARADVIIFVTSIANNSSITGPQVQMLEIADEEDPTIQASDKLFVFLNKIDSVGGPEALRTRIGNATNEWVNKAKKCLPERIIPGAAGAYLYKHATDLQASAATELVNSIADLERTEPPFGDGIEHLQEQIQHYLQTDRVKVLEKRSRALLETGKTAARNVLDDLAARYPQSPDELDREQGTMQMTQVVEWVDDTWVQFLDSLNDFWAENIGQVSMENPDGEPEMHDNFKQLEVRYGAIVVDLEKKYFLSEDEIVREYVRNVEHGAAQPEVTNYELRRELIKKRIEPGLEGVTKELAGSLLDIVKTIQDFVVEFFYDIEELRPVAVPLSDMSRYEDQVAYGLGTLFLRYARPSVAIFLKTVRGLPGRTKILRAHQNEVELLEMYFKGADAKSDLRRYLKTGKWEDMEEKVREVAAVGATVAKAVPGGQGVGSMIDGLLAASGQSGDSLPKPADTASKVAEEIREDCETFAYYLVHSVYEAASLEEFCRQELDRVRSHLQSSATKKVIAAQMVRAYRSPEKYPRIRERFNDGAFDTEMIRRMVEHRNQIDEALQKLERA